MGYPFLNILEFVFYFDMLNVIMMQPRFFANNQTEVWKLSHVMFLRFWRFEPHSYKLFSYKNNRVLINSSVVAVLALLVFL